MLPSLGALSLGAPTGAKDDVLTEIRDEVEAEKREWEAWHEEQEMLEAEARKRERLAPKSPPIHTLEPDPFSMIANELVKQLTTPDTRSLSAFNADKMCAKVTQVCHELATLNQLPDQTLNPEYNCSNPDAFVWKAAHAIFGVDVSAPSATQLKGHDLSWRDNFRALCGVYTPYYNFNYYNGATWKGFSLWGTFARDYQEGYYEEYRHVSWDDDDSTYEHHNYEDEISKLLWRLRRPIGTRSPGPGISLRSSPWWRIKRLPLMRRRLESIIENLEREWKDEATIEKEKKRWRKRLRAEKWLTDEDWGYYARHWNDGDYPDDDKRYHKDMRAFRALLRLFQTLEDQARDMQAAAS